MDMRVKKGEETLGPREDSEIILPISIFKEELCGLEAITKYLKENEGKTYKEISELTGRAIGTLGVTYKKSKSKKPEMYKITSLKHGIPISAIKNEYSILESICYYLKSKGFKNVRIAELIDKDPRTVWTVLNRVKEKIQ